MMKKIIFCLMLSCTTIGTTTMMQSCSSPVTALSSSNLSGITNQIVNVLGTKLGLNATQSPLVTNLVTQFLTSKLNLGNLMKTNPTQYASQFGSIQNILTNGLKGVLQAKQLTDFLALKPAKNDAKNVLSQLFY